MHMIAFIGWDEEGSADVISTVQSYLVSNALFAPLRFDAGHGGLVQIKRPTVTSRLLVTRVFTRPDLY